MRPRRAFAFIALLALSACSTIAEHAFARPTIAVRGVKLKSVGLTGGSIEVALFIANPNPYPLPGQARDLHASHSRTPRRSARGESTAAFTLPAHDSTVVDLPVDVSWQGLRAASSRRVTRRHRRLHPQRAPSRSTRHSATLTCRSRLRGRFTPPPSLLRSLP